MSRDRSRAKDPLKKTGYQIRLSVVQAVRDAVDQGAAESQNAFVERALVRELEELRRRRSEESQLSGGRPARQKERPAEAGPSEGASFQALRRPVP